MLTSLCHQLATKGHLTLTIRVRPNARKCSIDAVLEDGTIKVSLRSPPEGGKANEELLALIAEEFKVSVSNVELQSGFKSRHKRLRIRL